MGRVSWSTFRSLPSSAKASEEVDLGGDPAALAEIGGEHVVGGHPIARDARVAHIDAHAPGSLPGRCHVLEEPLPVHRQPVVDQHIVLRVVAVEDVLGRISSPKVISTG